MKKILAIVVLALVCSLSAAAASKCPVVRFISHPALLTHAKHGGIVVGTGAKKAGVAVKQATVKAAKATGSYGKKVLF